MSMVLAQLRSARRLAALLGLTVALAAAPAAEHVQKQGAAVLVLEAERVEADQVEISLSGELLLTVRVEGQAPLRVGASAQEFQQEQIKAMLASGAWRKCWAWGDPEVTELGQGRQRWQQRFRLDPLRDGQFDLQPAPLSVAEGPEGPATQIKWKSIPIRITTAIASPEVSELRDITPIEELPPGWCWRRPALWIGLGSALMALLVGGGQLLWRRVRRIPALPPDRWALGELERIEALALPAAAEVERYHTLISDVVRKYLELRFGLQAPQQTTAEFLAALARSSPLTPAHQALLHEFLERCDLAKFAQAWPSTDECQAVAAMARSFVQQTAAATGEPDTTPLRIRDDGENIRTD